MVDGLLLASFGLAFLFGWIAHFSHFCTLGALSDYVYMDDQTRLRQWGLAAIVALLTTQTFSYFQGLPLEKSIYLQPDVFWLAHLVGGSCFGVGMVLASGCGNKTLVRIGQGNLKAVIVLIVMGLTAMMTLKGILSVPRLALQQAVIHIDKTSSSLPVLFHLPPFGVVGGMSLFMSYWLFKDRTFWQNTPTLFSGFLIGLLIAVAWLLTGKLAYLEHPDTLEMTFLLTNSHAPESFSFIAPAAYLLEWLTLWTDQSQHLTFGTISVLGVILGSFCYSLFTKQFALESFADASDLIKHLVGAMLMGFGGVTGLGCTIGQGLSGISTLALGSFLTLFAILISSFLTLRYQYQRLMQEAS